MRKKIIFLLMFAGALAFVACQSKTIEDPAKLKQQVEEANAAYWATMLAGDYDELPSYYTDDAVLMPHGNEKMGVEGMIQQQNQGKEMGIKVDSYMPTTLDVWSCGDMVYEVGTYEMKTSMTGMPEAKSDNGSYICVWKKGEDGSLKRKYFIWNSAVVEQPAAAPEASFEGNWDLVSVEGTYMSEGEPINASMVKDANNYGMKMIHDNYFMFVDYRILEGEASAGYGYGTYTFVDNVYTETMIYHVGEDLIGKSASYEMTVEGDTLIQKGPLKIGDFKDEKAEFTETYVRQ